MGEVAALHAMPDPAGQLDREHIPSARLVMSQPEIDADPGRWLAERRRDPGTGQWRVTASELAGVLGLAPPEHASAFALYHAKVDGTETFHGNERTDLGLYLEGRTAAVFAQRHPELEVGPGGLYVSCAYPWLAATFDRIAYDVRFDCDCPARHLDDRHLDDCPRTVRETYQPAGPVQLKSWANYSDFGPDGSSVMPVHLRVQLLAEMAVLGTDEAWEPVQFLPSGKVRVLHVDRDIAAEADIAAILRGGAEFAGWLERGEEPEVDWTPATTRTLRALYPRLDERAVRIPAELAYRYDQARAAVRAAEERLGKAQNEIRHRLGDATDAVTVGKAGGAHLVARRRGGPRAGYSVPPNEWIEAMDPARPGQTPRPLRT